MIHTLRARSRTSLIVATLALALCAALARAQQPPAEQGGQPAAPQAPKAHLWWEDPELVAKLSLEPSQREQMGRLFESYERQLEGAGNPNRARIAFLEALRQGDTERARKELASWADGLRAQARATGDLKVGVVSLLNAKQRKALAAVEPDLIAEQWLPRPAWQPPRDWKPPTPRPKQPSK